MRLAGRTAGDVARCHAREACNADAGALRQSDAVGPLLL
jgi:hypothetical protein